MGREQADGIVPGFFFSSRRRHTRSYGDWSSDVCSSDLSAALAGSIAMDPANAADACNYLGYMWVEQNQHLDEAEAVIKRAVQSEPNNGEIGRASCRERVKMTEGGGGRKAIGEGRRERND